MNSFIILWQLVDETMERPSTENVELILVSESEKNYFHLKYHIQKLRV